MTRTKTGLEVRFRKPWRALADQNEKLRLAKKVVWQGTDGY